MADAARPAHPAGGYSGGPFPIVDSRRRRAVATVLALGLATLPTRAYAGPPAEAAPAGPALPSEPETAPESGAAGQPPAESDAGPSPEGDASPDPEVDAPAEAAADPESTTTEAAPADAESTTTEAEAEPDGDGKDAAPDAAASPGAPGPTAAPLRPMQTAAWWTMFGAFAVGTTAGVLAGLAERQEDRATRLSTLFDAETGAQPLYADRKDEYEQYLRRGEGYAKAAIGVGVVAGVATIAAITLFAIDATRQRGDAAPKQKRRATWRLRGGGMEVRF